MLIRSVFLVASGYAVGAHQAVKLPKRLMFRLHVFYLALSLALIGVKRCLQVLRVLVTNCFGFGIGIRANFSNCFVKLFASFNLGTRVFLSPVRLCISKFCLPVTKRLVGR